MHVASLLAWFLTELHCLVVIIALLGCFALKVSFDRFVQSSSVHLFDPQLFETVD